jgi:hypothetical protein
MPAFPRRPHLPLLLAGVFLMLDAVVSADFPPPDQLPAIPKLPDPLVSFPGKRIKTREDWVEKRRPELKKLFEHYMYGHLPASVKITARVERQDRGFLDGKATLKEITISFGPPETPATHLLLIVPNRRSGPAPVFVGMNFCGNHTVVKDPRVALPKVWMPPHCPGCKDNRATEDGRGKEFDTWGVDQIVGRGYALATFYSGDIDPDRPDARQGIQPHLRKAGSTPGPHDWGTIAAWAWGIHRVVDYLVTDADLDRERIAVVGHSRLGKTALLAAAFDERIALAIPHQAGCGGTAPSRGKVGESVKQINDHFPHWFNGAFKAFNGHPERLPFDQNCLVALVAPRPVLFGNAVEDSWANPDGQYDVLVAADPVYRFLGVEGLGARDRPEVNHLLNSRLGYFIRPGKHSMTREDWKFFLDFADKHLVKEGKKGK